MTGGPTSSDAWSDRSTCGNCGASLSTPFCGQCGQKAARRLIGRDIVRETWERWRLCEFVFARTIWHLVTAPGRVAREYVLGKRKDHAHPLTLLIATVAILVLMLAANRYFQHFEFAGENSDVDRMAQQVMALSTWSFSLGIFAILAGSWIMFWRRGFNFTEHAVLAIYCQTLILAIIIINMLPTLVWRSPEFILWHKAVSQIVLYAIKLLIVVIAYKQFFALDWKRDWLKLVTACLIYAGTSWVLVRLYATSILYFVTRA